MSTKSPIDINPPPDSNLGNKTGTMTISSFKSSFVIEHLHC
jgi:hypothetical protein